MNGRMLVMLGALALLGVLALLLVVLGKPSREVIPSSLSASPGGTLALYRLLEEEGIPVKRWYEEPIREDPEVGAVIYFQVNHPFDLFEESAVAPNRVQIVLSTPGQLPLPSEMERAEVEAQAEAFDGVQSILRRKGIHGKLESGLIREGQYAIVDLNITRLGTEATVVDGTMFLNQYLDQEDNAELAVALVRSVLPEGKALAFPEYAYGVTRQKNVFQEIGPAYSSFVTQFLLLFFLLIWTFHRRFGYPIPDPVRQPGIADHAHALAYALERARAYDLVLKTALQRVIHQESRRLGLPPNTPPEELAKRVEEPLASLLLRAVQLLEGQKPPSKEARLVASLLRERAERKTTPRIG